MNEFLDQNLTLQELVIPGAILLVGYLLKQSLFSKLKNIDQVPEILRDIRELSKDQMEIKTQLKNLANFRDEFVVLKSEVKSQWIRVDDNKRTIETVDARLRKLEAGE